MRQGRTEEAVEILRKLRSKAELEAEVDDIRAGGGRGGEGDGVRFRDLVATRAARSALGAGVGLQVKGRGWVAVGQVHAWRLLIIHPYFPRVNEQVDLVFGVFLGVCFGFLGGFFLDFLHMHLYVCVCVCMPPPFVFDRT